MIALLPSWPLLAAFLVASLVLAVTPGPGVFYIVTRALAQGRSAGLASVAGVALGNLGNAIGAAIGLGALFAVSSTAFTVVKYAGAVYLVYLGIKALRGGEAAAPVEFRLVRLRRIFSDGFIVALLNPKTAIFFAAFLPQFIDGAASPIVQSILLGALFAGAIAPALTGLRGVRAAGRYLTAGAFIGLGALTAATSSQSTPKG